MSSNEIKKALQQSGLGFNSPSEAQTPGEPTVHPGCIISCEDTHCSMGTCLASICFGQECLAANCADHTCFASDCISGCVGMTCMVLHCQTMSQRA